MERFEVEVHDGLLRRSVKRVIPDYETLELADPKDAIQAKAVRITGLYELARVSEKLVSFSEYLGGFLTGKELGTLPAASETGSVDPRYLYVLLHALGCRKLAFLLLGTRPLDEEEEALRDVAVIDVPLLRREYRPWVRHRSVRVVLLEAVPGPEPLGRFDRGGEAEGPAGSRRALNGREESGVERCDSAVVA